MCEVWVRGGEGVFCLPDSRCCQLTSRPKAHRGTGGSWGAEEQERHLLRLTAVSGSWKDRQLSLSISLLLSKPLLLLQSLCEKHISITPWKTIAWPTCHSLLLHTDAQLKFTCTVKHPQILFTTKVQTIPVRILKCGEALYVTYE